MKKHLHFAFVFLVLLITSCATDRLEVQENQNTNPENVWAYNGDNSTIKGVIQELKEGTNRVALERRLLKNDVLWENAEPLIIEDKKRILVPFLSVDKENIIGFFALYRDSKGKIQYDMTVRSDVYNKKIKLPFWDSSIWAGYFTAFDRTILGKRNGNPGVMKKAIPKEELAAMTSKFVTECYNVPHTTCVSVGDECYNEFTGERESCGGSTQTYCSTSYNWKCFTYWIEDEPTDTGSGDSGSGGSGGSGGDSGTNDNPLQIFNNLNGIADCIYQKLNVNSTNFKNAIKKFDGEFPVSHLTFIINNNLPVGNYGITNPPDNYNITIELSNTQLANISTLGGALAIAHEIVHAEIFRKLLSAAQKGDLNTNNYTTQENINFVNSLRNNFPGLYDYYYARVHPTWNHDLMAQHYRSTIADIAQQFDNNTFPRQVYEDLAWIGLKTIETNVNSIAWNNLTSTEQQRILSNITNIFHNGTKNCN